MKLFYYIFSVLIIVVGLFLLTVGIVIPAYHKHSFHYQLKTAMDASWVVKTAIRQHYETYQQFGTNNKDLGLDPQGAMNDYVLSSFNNNGVIILQLGNDIKSDYKSTLIIYTPEIKNNNVYWTCKSSNQEISQELINQYC